MNVRNLLAVLAGGLVAFIWSCISWMVIPWHQSTMNVFENEESIGLSIKQAAPEPGIYTYPGWTEDEEDMQTKHEAGPYVFASVVPGGVGAQMYTMLIGGLIVNIIGAGLLLALMLRAGGTDHMSRGWVGLIGGLAISVVPALMQWNWWHFPLTFTLVTIVDGVIMWNLAVFVMIKITTKKQP